mmetsp:Transcript_11007/g.23865  ORF Transcript_11007/g.23865 Transcript_11007/m.23865 type:complete len:295 (+) Transcript_11007:1385-2269(+)
MADRRPPPSRRTYCPGTAGQWWPIGIDPTTRSERSSKPTWSFTSCSTWCLATSRGSVSPSKGTPPMAQTPTRTHRSRRSKNSCGSFATSGGRRCSISCAGSAASGCAPNSGSGLPSWTPCNSKRRRKGWTSWKGGRRQGWTSPAPTPAGSRATSSSTPSFRWRGRSARERTTRPSVVRSASFIGWGRASRAWTARGAGQRQGCPRRSWRSLSSLRGRGGGSTAPIASYANCRCWTSMAIREEPRAACTNSPVRIAFTRNAFGGGFTITPPARCVGIAWQRIQIGPTRLRFVSRS